MQTGGFVNKKATAILWQTMMTPEAIEMTMKISSNYVKIQNEQSHSQIWFSTPKSEKEDDNILGTNNLTQSLLFFILFVCLFVFSNIQKTSLRITNSEKYN